MAAGPEPELIPCAIKAVAHTVVKPVTATGVGPGFEEGVRSDVRVDALELTDQLDAVDDGAEGLVGDDGLP